MTEVHSEARRRALRNGQALAESGLIRDDEIGDAERAGEMMSIAISPEMVDRIDRADADDPVARQFVPSTRELTILPEERSDPIGDVPYMPVKGITHRYPDRLLLIANHHCAVYCRFCFRKEKVGPGQEFLKPDEIEAALDYIRAQPELREVILTGGDPLMLTPHRIRYLVEQLTELPNLDVIRIHTRIPVVAPERVTPELLDALETDKIICVVVHANHANEFGDAAKAALKTLRKRGIMMVSHSVLLKGVNNTPQALMDLFREFIRNGVKVYYLHHCDLAEGVSHFRTTFEEGQELMRAIRGQLSGLAQPTYALHIPDGHGKVPIGPSYIEREGSSWIVEDYLGGRHRYPIDADGGAAM
jgi:lysine 2,3-aminomutase